MRFATFFEICPPCWLNRSDLALVIAELITGPMNGKALPAILNNAEAPFFRRSKKPSELSSVSILL